MSGTAVRFARPSDAAQIAELFISSFSAGIAQLLIYGCRGAPDYIRTRLGDPGSASGSAYLVAEEGGEVIGAAELRRGPQRLFLNYIAVDARQRGRGTGTFLLEKAVRMSAVGSGRIGLDVLHDNVRAFEWYSRLGFTVVDSLEFIELARPAGGDSAVNFSGLPQADQCHEQFGFSSFQLISSDRNFTAGRIGDRWFRLTDPEAAASMDVLSALARLDTRRRIFAILPSSAIPRAHVLQVMGRTHRMEMDIAELLSSLHDQHRFAL